MDKWNEAAAAAIDAAKVKFDNLYVIFYSCLFRWSTISNTENTTITVSDRCRRLPFVMYTDALVFSLRAACRQFLISPKKRTVSTNGRYVFVRIYLIRA